MTKPDPRVEALRRVASERTTIAVKKAEKGIRALIRDGGQINFQSVARVSGVSTRFLHQNADLTSRIRHLAAQQQGDQKQFTTPSSSISAQNGLVSALRTRIRDMENKHASELVDLRAKLREQDNQIAALYGERQRG